MFEYELFPDHYVVIIIETIYKTVLCTQCSNSRTCPVSLQNMKNKL